MSNENEREMLDLEPSGFIKNCEHSINECTPEQYLLVWTHIMDHFLINLENILEKIDEEKRTRENHIYKLLWDYIETAKEKLEEF